MSKAFLKKTILAGLIFVAAAAAVFFSLHQASAANPPALKEGTYLQGQTLSVWPSWTVLGNALGMALPADPINQLGKAGTCATTTNYFCISDSDCQPPRTTNPEKCILHDPNTGWSTENRRFSFACATGSYAYRYIDISTSTYEIRARLESSGVTINNWDSFMDSFVSSSIVRFDSDKGICSDDQEISTISAGKCGDGVINLINSEECDPPGRTRYGACGAEQANQVKVDVCNSACKWVASSTQYISCSALSKCGNSIIEAGESCDDGRLNGKYNHCSADCKNQHNSLGWCGDGVKQSAFELCDPGTGGDKYAFNRKDSCAWDCQHYGPYCGDGKAQPSTAADTDEIPGVLGALSGGVHIITSRLGKTILVTEHNYNPDYNYDRDGGRVSQGVNTWDYRTSLDQGSYSVQFITANSNQQDLSGLIDTICTAMPGVQHHLTVSADGAALGNYCAEATSTPQAGQTYAFTINSAGQHTITLNWDNDYWDGTYDSNLKIIKVILAKNLEECEGNKTCTTASGKTGTIFCNSQCKFAYPPDPEDGYCSTTKAAAVAPPGTCGDGVVDSSEACDKGLANNGKVCTPTYNKSCTYCSADCQHTIDVQATQYCGNSIVEGPEECDQDRTTGEIYRTGALTCDDKHSYWCLLEASLLLRYPFSSAHNGLMVRTCASDTPSDYYGFWKGTRECTSCKLVDNCVACGYDPEKGVEVSGGIILNVLEPVSTNPLYGLPAAPIPELDGVVNCKDENGNTISAGMSDCYEDGVLIRDPKIHLLITPTNTNPASGVFVGGKAWRSNAVFGNDYFLAAAPGDRNECYSSTPTKLNANAICSIGSPQYKLQFNNDPNPLHWQPFTIIEDKFDDKPWKYDLVLSPVIRSSYLVDEDDHQRRVIDRPQDVRMVLSWVGGSEFYGGLLIPMSRADRDQDILMEGPSFGTGIAGGLKYYEQSTYHDLGIWYHGLGYTPNQMNEEAFTVDISKMTTGLYVFYVRSASGPLSQLRSSAKLRIDVYLPEENVNTRYFAQPAKTFYLATAIPSDNAQASYLQVFNLLAIGNQATEDNIMDVNAVATAPKDFTFTASCVGRPGKICRAAMGPCDIPTYCGDGSAGRPLSDDCPDAAFAAQGTVCRAAAGACDQAEVCNGITGDCPPDLIRPAGYVCNTVDEDCAPTAFCDGVSAVCPTPVYTPAETPCYVRQNYDQGTWHDPGKCNGAGICVGLCYGKNPGDVCRPAVGNCDNLEVCDAQKICPSDSLVPNGTICRNSTGECDPAEKCTGSSSICPDNVFTPVNGFCTLCSYNSKTHTTSCSPGKCDINHVCHTLGSGIIPPSI